MPNMENRMKITRNIFILGMLLFAASYVYNNYIKYAPKKVELNIIFQKIEKKDNNLLIFDIRKIEEFNKLSLKNSIHIRFNEVSEAVKALRDDNTIKYNTQVILFGDKNNDMEEFLLLLKDFQLKDIIFYNNGFNSIDMENINKAWID
jgi:rhodanese-related sulfurtransferase